MWHSEPNDVFVTPRDESTLLEIDFRPGSRAWPLGTTRLSDRFTKEQSKEDLPGEMPDTGALNPWREVMAKITCNVSARN